MMKKQVQRMLFRALNAEENEEIVTLSLSEENQEVWIQFQDGTKYKIRIEETHDMF